MTSGIVLLVAGPSGSGKTCLINGLVRRVPFLTKTVTVTTREPRQSEINGVDYHFVTQDVFLQLQNEGELVECTHVYGEHYGIPRSAFAGICDRAIILTYDGALALRQRLRKALTIFIDPGSASTAAERVRERNAPNAEARIASLEDEIRASRRFDRVFHNLEFEKTLNDLANYYLEQRQQLVGIGRRTLALNRLAGTPRVVTSHEDPCRECLQGRMALVCDLFPRWFRDCEAVGGRGTTAVTKRCTRLTAQAQEVMQGAPSPTILVQAAPSQADLPNPAKHADATVVRIPAIPPTRRFLQETA